MARLIIFTFFVALTAAAAADFALRPEAPKYLRPIPIPALLGPAQEDITECDGIPAGQTVCADNCTKVVLCMGGTLDPTVLDECTPPLACDVHQGKCVNDSSSCVTVSTTITCNDLGLFPDPTVCTSYHICFEVGEESMRENCESGWAYDPLTTLCSKQLTDAVCTNLPIECSNLGESNAFPGNSNIYYICIADDDEILYPDLHRCPHGGSYDPDTYSCGDASPTPPSQTNTPSTPPSQTNTPSTPTTSTMKPPSPGGPCSTALEIVADPDSCYGYYKCSGIYKWTYIKCNTGYYFNKDELRCVYGNCIYSWSF